MKRILLSIAVLALSINLSAEISQKTYEKYCNTIDDITVTDISKVGKLRKPIEAIIDNGSEEQRMWLSATLQRVNFNDVKADVRWEYSYWMKSLSLALCEDNPMLKSFLPNRYANRHFWMHFYPGRNLSDSYIQEANFLGCISDCINMYTQQQLYPELESTVRDIMRMRAHYIDFCLNGNDSTATALYGTLLSPQATERLATLLGSRAFEDDPTQFRPLFEKLTLQQFDQIISIYPDIWAFCQSDLSNADMNAVYGLISQYAQTLGRVEELYNIYYTTMQTYSGLSLQWYQTNLDMLLLHNDLNQDLYSSFFQFKQELIDQGKEFVNYAPMRCPPELQEDSLFMPYAKEYVRFGYALCQELDANGIVNYIRTNGELIRNMLNNMGYDTTNENWEYLFAQYISDLITLSIQFYESDNESWLVGACVLEARLIAALTDLRGFYCLYNSLADAAYFINRYMNDEESVKFLMDTYLIPFLSGENMQSIDRYNNCYIIYIAATILPYVLLYDEPYRTELGEALADRLNKAVRWNIGCDNNGFAKIQLADYYMHYYNFINKDDAYLAKGEKYLNEFFALTGDTAGYYLYKMDIASTKKDYSTAAAYLDWLNRDDPAYVSDMMDNKSLSPAWVYAMAGQDTKALEQLDLFRVFTDEYFGSQMLMLGDEQAANMLKRYAAIDETFVQLCHDSISMQVKQSSIGYFYDWQLLTKGVLLALNSETDAILSNHPNAKVRELHAQRKQQETQLSAMTDKNSLEAERLQTAITNTQRNLTEVLQQYIDKHGFSGVNLVRWQQVQTALKSGEVAIEFAKGKIAEDTISTYYALLLRHGDNEPRAIELFRENDLLQLTEGKNENLIYNDPETNMQVTHTILDSLQAYLHDGQTIYFSPSGMLHQIAFENMLWTEDSLVSQKYDMHRLSSTRQLTLNKSREDISSRDSVVLYGGIVYDAGRNELLAESQRYPDQQLLAMNRSVTKDDIDRGAARFLPGAQKEVQAISQMLSGISQPHDLRMGVHANEESFKALNLSHTALLHIATHGFFWENDAANSSDYFKNGMSEEQALRSIDPMRRCGLLMAGANIALSGHAADLPEGVQDGVLTAQEISLLDLSDTRLVILSACETGVGEVNGDGVFGLQRAFKKAGVQTLIMSLWKVSDQATQLLMTEFYRNWITLKQPQRTAFRNAQNTVRNRFDEPVYWAGFIMLD